MATSRKSLSLSSHLDPVRQQRAASFGSVAAAYDQFRPGYPDQLFEDLLELAPGNRVLDVGSGTGRAAMGFASRGAHVVGIEHDPEMAAVASERGREFDLQMVVSRFEDYHPEPDSFDLVTCAQAWHWIDPIRGEAVAADALVPNGALCIWWNRPAHFDGPLWETIHQIYQQYAPALDRMVHLRERAYDAPIPYATSAFTPWVHSIYTWNQTYTAEEYVGFLGTHSDHILLPEEQRTPLLVAVRDAIDAAGGTLDYAYRTLLSVARKKI